MNEIDDTQNSEGQSPLIFFDIWHYLVEPFNSVQGTEERHKARLLTTEILVIFISLVISTVYLRIFLNYPPSTPVIASLIIFGCLYAISRTTIYQYTAWFIIGYIPFMVLIMIFGNYTKSPITMLFALLFDIIVALGFLSLKQFSLLTLGNLLVILILARFDNQVFPSIYAFYNVMFVNIMGAFVAMIFLRYKTISEKDRQQRLTVSEARYKVISELSSDFSRSEILTPNGTFTIEWLSEAIEQISGFPSSGSDRIRIWEEVVHPDDKLILRKHYKKVKTGESSEVEYRIITRRGTVRWLHEFSRPVWDEQTRTVVRIISASQDITERKKADRELQRVLEWQQAIFEGSRDAILISNRETNFVAVNRAACELTGYTESELLSMHISDLHDKEDMGLYSTFRLIMTGKEITSEAKILRKDGTKVNVEFSNRRIIIANIPYMHTVARDITERKKFENALRESEEKYRQLIQYAPAGIFEIDMRTRKFITVNEVMCKYLGYSREELLEKNIYTVLADNKERDQLAERLSKMLGGDSTSETIELKMKTKSNQEVWMLLNIRLVREFGKPLVAQAVVSDTTERVLADAEREALIAELEANNAELERFTYTVSHDLKSPLITIRGFLGYLEEEARNGEVERMQEDIQRISKAAERMQQLLDELLKLSRIGRVVNPPEPIQLRELVEDIIQMMETRLQEANIKTFVDPQLPTIYGDRQRLQEVFTNLIDNATRFMGDQTEPYIEVGIRHDEEEFVYYVLDNGIGIDPRYHDRVFNLFEKLDASSDGTGVGLAIAQRIIEQHGGRIWVESEGEGKGSAFCFTLPQKQEDGNYE